MKRLLLFLVAVLLIVPLAHATAGYPRHPNISNTTLTKTTDVYSLTIPSGTGEIKMQSRGANDFKIGLTSNLSDGVIFTVKSGTVLSGSPLGVQTQNQATQDTTIYLQGTAASQVVELLYWN